jgi:hypothetical protein
LKSTSRMLVAGALALGSGLFSATSDTNACGNGKLLFQDNFETLNPAWGFREGAAVRSNGPEGLTYKLDPDREVTLLNQSSPYDNYEVCAVYATQTAANANPWLGIVFWAEDEDNAHDATIWPKHGIFAVYRHQNKKTLTQIAPTRIGSMLTGTSVITEISVTVNGKEATLAVNGNKVTDFRGQPPERGSLIGFTFGTHKTDPGPTTVTLKNIQVREVGTPSTVGGAGDAGLARSDHAVDRLSVHGPIEFNGESYRLTWSSHPTPYYYKQEYLPAGETSKHFQRMVLIEAIVRGGDVNGAVAAQVNMLNKRKATDPTVNFAIFKNPKSGEIILDFVLSAQDPKGEDVVEWNAYRYAPLKRKGGKSGVLLFGISRRAYGDNVADFLGRLKAARPAVIKVLANYPLPVVRPMD